MKDFKDATVPEKLDRMIKFLEKWNGNITIVPEDKKYLIEIKALIEKQQEEIEFYKREELGYIAGYEDGKRHKQTAVAMRNENAQYEIIRKNIEIKDAKIEQLQKEIEELKNIETYKIAIIDKDKYISKDKIKAKIEELEKEQDDNRKRLYNAVNNLLCFKEIDKISNKICVNMTVTDILQSLLEEE